MSETQGEYNQKVANSSNRLAASRIDKGSDAKRIESLEERVTALEAVIEKSGLHLLKSPTIVKE
jgi:hypothetical protein